MLPVDVIGTDPNTANNIADKRYDLSALQWDPAELAQLNVELHPTADRTAGLASACPWPRAWPMSPPLLKSTPTAPPASARRTPAPQRLRPADWRARTARLQGPAAGWRSGPRRRSCTMARCRRCINCFRPSTSAAETFYRGTFEYDPRHLGYRTEAFDGGFVLDTRITGNHNSGHEFRAGQAGQWGNWGACCNLKSAGPCWST
jgi:hypothetical protein